MNLLERLFTSRKVAPTVHYYSKNDPTNPYSPSMAKFFNEISLRDPEQMVYLVDFTDVPELKEYLKPKSDPQNGDFLGFEVTDMNAYSAKKRDLKLI